MKKLLPGILLISSCGLLRADFTYQETTQMTGGSLMTMMRALGPLTRGAREPIVATHIFKGNRMATVTKDRTNIMDLDKETITNIDHAKKTYSVMTFAEMKQAMEDAAQRAQGRKNEKSEDVKANFKVSAKATGQTKVVQGLSAKEMVIEMELEGANTKTGESGAMTISTDAWYAPVPGYDEVKAFYQKMAVKMGYMFGSGMQQIAQMGAGQPNMQRGFEEVARELSKIDGVPVESLVKMGGTAAGGPGDGSAAQPPPQQQQRQDQGSGGGIAGAALGRLGGFGGLGRRKNNDQQKAQEQPAAGQQQTSSGTLMEMTMTLTSFSSGSADASKFEIPAGYKQIDSDLRRGGR
jgi:hypothetical protein